MKRLLLYGALVLSACTTPGIVASDASKSAQPRLKAFAAEDPLPSWNDGTAKQKILDFVKATTTTGPDYVARADRVATFDLDGTLWVEQPLYAQQIFELDQLRLQAKSHPEWASREPFKSALSLDARAIASFNQADWLEILDKLGIDDDKFACKAEKWSETGVNPKFGAPVVDLVYLPMLEVMHLLRQHGYRTYLVSGASQEFVRGLSEHLYGVPPEHVMGSRKVFIDEYFGKVFGINWMIGIVRRPYAAFGNSVGDAKMLEWTGAGGGKRLEMLLLHDDAIREFAYGPADGLPDTKRGRFTQVLLKEAEQRGWTVIRMKRDWKQVFPTEHGKLNTSWTRLCSAGS